MTTTAVSHEMLLQGQVELRHIMEAQQRQVDAITTSNQFLAEGQRDLRDYIERGTQVSHMNEIALARIEEKVNAMFETRDGHISRLEQLELKVYSLQTAMDRQAGRDGVFGFLARSPIVIGAFGLIGGYLLAFKHLWGS